MECIKLGQMFMAFLRSCPVLFISALFLTGCSGGGGTEASIPNLMGGAIQRPLTLAGSVSTFAGVAPGVADGTGSAARLNYPMGVATDGANLYVADSQSHVIRKVVIATGEVTTLAGSALQNGATDGIGSAARFNTPKGITSDGKNLYVADTANSAVRKVVIATGEVTTLAGSAGVFGATDGAGSVARFNYPFGITSDGTNLYVADTFNFTLRKVVIATGEVTTLAGSAGGWGTTDGTGSAARFGLLQAITTDGTNLFMLDTFSQTVRKVVISSGAVTTLAGAPYMAGSTDGTGSAARFNYPFGIATDRTNLYVSDGYNRTIRKVAIATGVVTTVAGSVAVTGSTDGTGTAALFNLPAGIATDGANLFVADNFNNNIRKIVVGTGAVTTLAGNSSMAAGSTDGSSSAARFSLPGGVTTDGTSLYVVDTNNNTIRKVLIATGAVTTLAGNASVGPGGHNGTGSAALFNNPNDITTDGTNLYVTDTNNHTIRKIVIATGVVTTLAGGPTAEGSGLAGSADGAGFAARFNMPGGITTDGTNVYVADLFNSTIRKIEIATGVVTTLAGSAGMTGSADGIGAAARFNMPGGVTTDGKNVYVADIFNHTIRKIVIATGAVTTLAGSAGVPGSTDGTGAGARFRNPGGIMTDGTNLYISDHGNHLIRKVVITTGEVTTLAGSPGIAGSVDGTGSAAKLNNPYGLISDGTSLYVSDNSNNAIRKIQ